MAAPDQPLRRADGRGRVHVRCSASLTASDNRGRLHHRRAARRASTSSSSCTCCSPIPTGGSSAVACPAARGRLRARDARPAAAAAVGLQPGHAVRRLPESALLIEHDDNLRDIFDGITTVARRRDRRRRAGDPAAALAPGHGAAAARARAGAVVGRRDARAARRRARDRRRRRRPARPTSLSTAGLFVFASVPWVFLFGLVRSGLIRAGAVSELLLRSARRPAPGAALPAGRRARRPLARPRVLARGQEEAGSDADGHVVGAAHPTRCSRGRRSSSRAAASARSCTTDAQRGARAAALGRCRRRPGDGERAPASPAARPRRGAAHLARPDRRGRHAGAPPARAQPARRRPAAARRAVADAAARPGQARTETPTGPTSCSTARRRSSRSRSPSCASSPAASTRRSCPTAASGRRSRRSRGARRSPSARRDPRGAAARADRGGRLLRGRRGAHQRRQVRPRQPGHGARQPLQRARRGRGRRRRSRRRRSGPRLGSARARRPRRPRSTGAWSSTRPPGRALGSGRRSPYERTTPTLRVVIADDSVLLREGLARLLEESGFEVAGQAGDAEDLLRKVGAHKPDVAVVDVRMPPTHTDEGLRAAHRDPRRAPRDRGARALPVRRGGLRARAAVGVDRAHRLPAQGPRRRRRHVHRRRAPRRRRRLGARPRGRRAAARPPPPRGPARGADRRASARCSG